MNGEPLIVWVLTMWSSSSCWMSSMEDKMDVPVSRYGIIVNSIWNHTAWDVMYCNTMLPKRRIIFRKCWIHFNADRNQPFDWDEKWKALVVVLLHFTKYQMTSVQISSLQQGLFPDKSYYLNHAFDNPVKKISPGYVDVTSSKEGIGDWQMAVLISLVYLLTFNFTY